MEKVAFAYRIAPKRASLLEGLADSLALDPGVDLLCREMGASRLTAWLQAGRVPLVVVYSEWKVDPVEGFGALESSREEAGDRIRAAIRQVVSDPSDAALDITAGRSRSLLEWSSPDRRAGAEIRCYARFVPRERALAMQEFFTDLRADPALLNVFSRLRERAGMTKVEVWAAEVAGDEVMLIEGYESDDLDVAFERLATSRFDLERRLTDLAVHSLGWAPGAMPEVRLLYDWRS